MVLFTQLMIGAFMIGLTVAVHAVALDFIIRHIGYFEQPVRRIVKKSWKSLVTGGVVVTVFAVHVVIIWLWAGLFMAMQCSPLQSFSETLYFATVAYTTIGFGDIVLGESCRMLSGISGADGTILFGWTAAFIFEVVGQIYRKEASTL